MYLSKRRRKDVKVTPFALSKGRKNKEWIDWSQLSDENIKIRFRHSFIVTLNLKYSL